VEIADVAFTLHHDTVQVKAFGNLPLYEIVAVEDGLKKWLFK
jgi:hypothetical protein